MSLQAALRCAQLKGAITEETGAFISLSTVYLAPLITLSLYSGGCVSVSSWLLVCLTLQMHRTYQNCSVCFGSELSLQTLIFSTNLLCYFLKFEGPTGPENCCESDVFLKVQSAFYADFASEEPSDILKIILTSTKTFRCSGQVTFLFPCVCWCESKTYQHRGAGSRFLSHLNLSISSAHSCTPAHTHTHSSWIRPTRLGWSRQEWATRWPARGRAGPLWGCLTVSTFSGTPCSHADIHPAWNRCRVVWEEPG